MANVQYYDVILKPVVTEKSMNASIRSSGIPAIRAAAAKSAAAGLASFLMFIQSPFITVLHSFLFCFWYVSAHTDSRLLYHKTKNSAKFIFEKILQNLSLTNSGLAGILLLGIIVTVQ